MTLRGTFFALIAVSPLMLGCSKPPPSFDTEHFGRTRQWMESQASALLRECDGGNAFLVKRELDALNQVLASVKDRKISWRATIGSVSQAAVVFSIDDGAESTSIQFAASHIKGMANVANLGGHGEFHGGWSPTLSMATSTVPDGVKQLRSGDAVTFEATVCGISANVSPDSSPPRPGFEVMITEPSLSIAHR